MLGHGIIILCRELLMTTTSRAKLCGKELLCYEELQFLEQSLERLPDLDEKRKLHKQIDVAKRLLRGGDGKATDQLILTIKHQIAETYDRCKIVK